MLSPTQTLALSMVSAATQTKPGSAPLPVQVKFALRARPDVAQPLDIDLQIVPTASNLDRIFGKVEGDDGLELVGSDELAEAEKPLENTPIDRSIKVLPKKNGIYLVTASVSVDIGGQISTQTYQIPVIAGSGIPDLPVKPAAAPHHREHRRRTPRRPPASSGARAGPSRAAPGRVPARRPAGFARGVTRACTGPPYDLNRVQRPRLCQKRIPPAPAPRSRKALPGPPPRSFGRTPGRMRKSIPSCTRR